MSDHDRLESVITIVWNAHLAAIEQALQFGLFDLGRLEKLILKRVIGDFFTLDAEADDDA